MLRQFSNSLVDIKKKLTAKLLLFADIFCSQTIKKLLQKKSCDCLRQPITRANNQFGFSFWYQHLNSKLHFVLRDKKVVLIPKLLLARER